MEKADWESQFWKQFFEASANVSLSGYEEPTNEEDVTNTETTSTQVETPTEHGEYSQGGAHQHEEDEEDFTVDSPTQITGTHATPKLSGSGKKSNLQTKSPANFGSPSPRKYTGRNPRAIGASSGEPSTPRPQGNAQLQSSPFEPESAYQPSGQRTHTINTKNDPLMHRVLDKNYRIQATPHTQRRQRHQAAAKPTPPTATKTAPWDDSPQSSPAMAAPELRSDLFSPAKPSYAKPNGPRTPGISILTPAARRTASGKPPTTSTGRQLFSPQDKAYTSAAARPRDPTNNANSIFSSPFASDEDDEDDAFGMSPPKTMQFHVPQSRLMQTPAREASKKIVEDLLLTAGADATDEIEGAGGDGEEIDFEEPSPSVVRRAWMDEDDTF